MNVERSQDPSLVEEAARVADAVPPVGTHLGPAPEEEPHARPRRSVSHGRLIPKWLSILLTILGAVGAAVLVITAVAAIVVPRLISRTDQAKMAAAKSDEATLVAELEAFHQDCGRYPTADEGLEALENPPADVESKWKGPYVVAAIPVDPWGHAYLYRTTRKGGVSIESYGSDGQPGGEASTSETDIVKQIN